MGVQMTCPHLLRYLTVAFIISYYEHVGEQRGVQTMTMEDLLTEIKLCRDQYKDPITEFVYHLCDQHNFHVASQWLKLAHKTLLADFLLRSCTKIFLDACRRHMFKQYCQVHNRVDMKTLSNLLHLPENELENWVVHVILSEKIDARVDCLKQIINVRKPQTSLLVYQNVLNKTANYPRRTTDLMRAVRASAKA